MIKCVLNYFICILYWWEAENLLRYHAGGKGKRRGGGRLFTSLCIIIEGCKEIHKYDYVICEHSIAVICVDVD